MLPCNIITARVGFARLTVGTLGYQTSETNDQVILRPGALPEGTTILSAHAPSELVIHLPEPTRLAAAANASFNAPAPVRAWIDWHHIGTLTEPCDQTPWIDLPPGTYQLRLETTGPADAAHTLWLLAPSNKPATGRLALCTVGCYPVQELHQKLAPLYRTAANREMLVQVDQAGLPFWNLFTCKIEKFCEFLEKLPEVYSHVLFVDACDCLIAGNETDILQKLRDGVVISTEDCSWPVTSEDWKEHFTVGPHRFPNTGVIGGPREAVIAAYRKIIDLHYQLKDGRGPKWAFRSDNAWTNPWMDQFLWQVAIRMRLVDVRLDHNWDLCACLTCTCPQPIPNGHFCLVQGGIELTTGQRPPVIHLPGPGKALLKAWLAVCEV